ncbi:polyketide oxidase, partial [Streptomyces sp. NPDC059956]
MGEVRFLEPHTAHSGYEHTPQGWTLTWPNPFGPSRVITYDFRGPAAEVAGRAPDGLLDTYHEEPHAATHHPGAVPKQKARWKPLLIQQGLTVC